ncbi:MAG: magnesium chelatase [Flavobacteriales bacterium]
MTASPDITTLGALKKSGYATKSVKQELRDNLIAHMGTDAPLFEGVLGYDTTVIPDVQRALLSRHSMILLGLRGQAKTRIARQMTDLLDAWIPVVAGSEMNDDPLQPLSRYAKDLIAEKGDDTPIAWLHRSDRYVEKLATPDVSVADLIGDVDPIKAANMGLDYSDERVLHFGLIPRSHRCIFAINELPDLQPRIQVSLFNILQEGDIQIRGFQLRLPLDIQFVFTANPEDYTNRGAIITPLKDRIQSQILTHYLTDLNLSQSVTAQEAQLHAQQHERVVVPGLLSELVERISQEARQSEFIDQKSGVSARLTISAYENLVSAAERRALINGEERTRARISDLVGVVPAITGKIELVYEGEQEGPWNVAMRLVGAAIRTKFPQLFPDPEGIRRRGGENPYMATVAHFNSHELELPLDANEADYRKALLSVPGLEALVTKYVPGAGEDDKYTWMEFALHGLAENSLINKSVLDDTVSFSDLLNQIFSGGDDEEVDPYSN